jgi:hypothetical protein
MVMAGIINSACTATRYDNVGRILEEKNYSKFVNSSGDWSSQDIKVLSNIQDDIAILYQGSFSKVFL